MSRDLIEEARQAVARAKLIVENARMALERAQRTRRDIEAARRRHSYFSHESEGGMPRSDAD